MRRMPTTERGSAMTLKTRVAVLVLAIVLVMTVGAIGQGSSPNNPIPLVTHSSVGAGGDIFLRNLARHLEGIVNVPVVVENRSGGASARAGSYVANRPPAGSLP